MEKDRLKKWGHEEESKEEVLQCPALASRPQVFLNPTPGRLSASSVWFTEGSLVGRLGVTSLSHTLHIYNKRVWARGPNLSLP